MAQTKKPKRPEIIVDRDPTFHRAVADKVLALDLGRDIELAFLQGGAVVKRMIDWDDETEQAEMSGSLTEVVRIRVTGPVALSIAINLIDTLVGAGKVKTQGLTEMISKIIAKHSEDE